MSMLANLSRTGTNILGTVSTTANSITQGVNTIASAMDMADAFIQKHKEKQLIDNTFEMKHYVSSAKANALMNAARAHHEVTKELNANLDLKDIYNDMLPEFDEIENEIKTNLADMKAKRTNA